MTDFITFGVLSFTSFFTLINPFGTMPIFMTMTAELDSHDRTKIAKKASIVSFITIILFASQVNCCLIFSVFLYIVLE